MGILSAPHIHVHYVPIKLVLRLRFASNSVARLNGNMKDHDMKHLFVPLRLSLCFLTSLY